MTNQTKPTFSRLPKNVIPNHYFINIRPDLDKFTFTGNERIQVDVHESTNTILINSLDIEIQSASFVSKDQEQKATKIEIKKVDELAVFTFENSIQVGPGELRLVFSGEINDKLEGCYRSKYIASNGEVRYGLATQFESTHCRKAFPCYDEPELKAKFDLTLIAPKDRVAISNMSVVEESDDSIDSSKRVLKFATTPIMSTYLVAYLIGEYEFIEQMTKNKTRVRVYTPIGKTEQAKFALDVGVRCLEFYEEYFQIPFMLPKLDMCAITDFVINGMENFGLITYRETALLSDPQNSSEAAKRWVAVVVCHEIAHQWFGNLVTMKWWSDLWLKEGFASFMPLLPIEHMLSKFKIWQDFITSTFSAALDLDALQSSHPIQVPVNHPSEIEEIFDVISYKKGASVICMLYNFIGNEDFRKGMHQYLTKFSYKNTETDDLWQSLEEASNKPIRSMMSSWTKQKGFPMIRVTSRQDGSNRIITLSQEKFSIDGDLSELDRQAKWLVPISIITQNNPKPMNLILEDRSQQIVLENVEATEWIKLNPNMNSFYRVQYPIELLEQLQSSIANKTIATIDRLNIQNDLFALVKAGKTSSDQLFKLLESFINEDEYIVWYSIAVCLSYFNNLLAYTDYQELYHSYVRKLLAKIHSRLGNKPIVGEDDQNAVLRSVILSLLASSKDPEVLKETRKQFDAHVDKSLLISANLRETIYSAVASDCDDKTFNKLFELHDQTELNAEKDVLTRALGKSKDVAQIQRSIDFAFSNSVRSQDALFVIGRISKGNKVGNEVAWNYFRENHTMLRNKYSSIHVKHLIRFLTEDFASRERLEEVRTFFEVNPIPSAERTIQQALESIKLNADLLARDSLIIKNYLTNLTRL